MINTYRIANFISNIFSPYIVASVLIICISIYSTNLLVYGIFLSFLTLLFLFGPVLIYSVIQIRRGVLSDIHVKNQKQRNVIFLIGGISLLMTISLLYYLDSPQVLFATLYSALLANGINYFVNKKTKISFHTGAMAGVSAILLILMGIIPALIIGLLTVIVGWSRVKIHAHSVTQVVLGGLNGFVVTVVVFQFFYI